VVAALGQDDYERAFDLLLEAIAAADDDGDDGLSSWPSAFS
jgi:hypothetical protein